MATISKTGIQDGLTSKAEHITRVIDSLDGTATTTIVATGSFTGSFTGDGSALTGVAATSQINLHFNTLGIIGTVSPSVNWYFGNDGVLNQNSASINAQFIPYDGQVTSVIVRNSLAVVSGDPHLAPIQFYNFTTNTSSSLEVSLAHDTRLNAVAKSGSTIPVSAGDRVMIKIETPAFGTNPTNAYYFADVLIEKT
tara:strand:- start:95 stop:682 length:588 start_codon:yes stop_codon:yes gene_type:complete